MVESSPQIAKKLYLIHFRKDLTFLDFCLQELESLVCMISGQSHVEFREEQPHLQQSLYQTENKIVDLRTNPCVYCELPADEKHSFARALMKRSVMIKDIIEVFGEASILSTEGVDKEVLKQEGYKKLLEQIDAERLGQWFTANPQKRFKFNIEGIGRKISIPEQLKMIESFKGFAFRDEDVSLDDPQVIFKIIECVENGMIYFGILAAADRESEKSGKDKNDDTHYGKYTLKKRPYLGPTSTDHILAFLMAN